MADSERERRYDVLFGPVVTEPPEQAACRSRTDAEQLAIVRRVRRMKDPACFVCGERHDVP